MSEFAETIFRIVKPQIKVETDIIIAFTHVVLCEVKFRCLTKNEQGEEDPSTFLPENWNENSDKYYLRYKLDDEVFALVATVVDKNIILNLMSEKTLECTAMALSIKETVPSMDGTTWLEIVPGYEEVVSRLNVWLIDPFRNSSPNDSASSTSSAERKIGAYERLCLGYGSDSTTSK